MEPGPLPRRLLTAERHRDGSWTISFRLSTGLVGYAHLTDGALLDVPVPELLEAVEARLPAAATVPAQPAQIPPL